MRSEALNSSLLISHSSATSDYGVSHHTRSVMSAPPWRDTAASWLALLSDCSMSGYVSRRATDLGCVIEAGPAVSPGYPVRRHSANASEPCPYSEIHF